MATTYHLYLDVPSALRWDASDLKGMFRDAVTGRTLTATEARRFLRADLAKGRVKLPLGPQCEGFDPTGGGCPGHPSEGSI